MKKTVVDDDTNDSEKLEDKLTPVDLGVMIQNVSTMLRSVMPRSLVINTFVARSSALGVVANADRLQQAIMNICINARDAMKGRGTISIVLSAAKPMSGVCSSCHLSIEGRFLELSLSDGGAGIDAGMLSRVFEPFSSTKQVGAGMGVAMAHGAIHDVGGHIIVEGEPGQGTLFRMLFPALEGESESEGFPPANIQEEIMWEGKNAVVVDDEITVANFIAAFLKNAGFAVNIFDSATVALDYFDENIDKVDLVVTDQTMPNLSGVALSKKILAMRSDVPIVLVTGYSNEIDERGASEMGLAGFVIKPFTTADFYSVLRGLSL